MSELGERFAREEMEREMRDEELAEDLGLEGKALEDFWRRRREIQSMQFMIDLEMDPAFQSPASRKQDTRSLHRPHRRPVLERVSPARVRT